ncbi:MAG TPA: CpcT/CpeT family chromophore lyase, partial [Flavobacteriales bacterium]|nr:CpcT/CpeT family chromophore lyase [Flavobacteriales bacterium]
MRATITLICIGVASSLFAQRTPGLEQLAATMEGSYTSAAQAKTDTSYYEIELEMKRIWAKRKDGVWFYVEQAVAGNKEKPYRQRVYHVQALNDSTFTS